MATTTPAGAPAPTIGDAPNVPADILALATYLDRITLPRFATTAARDAAFATPWEGQEVTVGTISSAVRWRFSKGAWRKIDIGSWNYTVDIPTGATYNQGTAVLDATRTPVGFSSTGIAGGDVVLPADRLCAITVMNYCAAGFSAGDFSRLVVATGGAVAVGTVLAGTIGAVGHDVMPTYTAFVASSQIPRVTLNIKNSSASTRTVTSNITVAVIN